MAVSNEDIPLKGKIQENELLAFEINEVTLDNNSKLIVGTTFIGSIVAEMFNPKDTSELLIQHFRTIFDNLLRAIT